MAIWIGTATAEDLPDPAYAANDGAQRFYARHGFAVRSVILDRDVPPRPAASSG